jgi:hypothetical protein
MIEYVKRLAGPFTSEGQSRLPFGFLIFEKTDVYVATADDPEAQAKMLVYGQDYSVEMNADQTATPGGTVVLTTPIVKGNIFVVGSAVAYTQNMQLTNFSRFPPEIINESLDRIVVQIQQLVELTGRTISLPPTSNLTVSEFLDNLFNAAKSAAKSAEEAKKFAQICEEIKQNIFIYSWDIPHVVDTLDDVEKYPYDGFFAVGGYGDPGHHGQDISNRVVNKNGLLVTLKEAFDDALTLSPVVRFVSTTGKGDGTSVDNAMSISNLSEYLSTFKNRLRVHFADGTYQLDTLSIQNRTVALVGNAEKKDAVVLDFAASTGHGLHCVNSDVQLIGLKINAAKLDGVRCDAGSLSAEDVSCTSCGHSGFSANENARFCLKRCTSESNHWNGFSFSLGCFGSASSCTASRNSINGFISNYTGSVYFADCVAESSGSSGFFISGCSSAYIDRSRSDNNAVAGVLASGLCRVSVQLSSATGNPRGFHAEYGADITLCDVDTDGGSVGPASAWGAYVAQYGGRVSYAYGSKVGSVSNYRRGCYALSGGRIDLVRPTESYLKFTNCSEVSSPAMDSYGNNGGTVSGGAAKGTNPLETALSSGQIGDARAVGSVSLNTLVQSGTYHCNGSSTDKPAGFGQCLISVYKRPTNDGSRKIVQVVYDLSSVSMALRYGSCPQGDDTVVNWTPYQKVTTAAI